MTSQTNHGRSRRHQTSVQSSPENHNSRNSKRDEDLEEEAEIPTSPDISDSQSSDDDDDSEDEISPVIFNHPLVDDLLDRFMRAQLQNDVNVNNTNNNKNNNPAERKLEFYHESNRI
ncbi:unnamed protein product [Onchocerca flexuosa]|uniref:Myb domain-containing protein n=1 Tax=Onchocerca flexuosa TaxID=387005 RepID=A0A183HH05_9BILA|nr:unnamed protein product [Onchocerca flexuosa]